MARSIDGFVRRPTAGGVSPRTVPRLVHAKPMATPRPSAPAKPTASVAPAAPAPVAIARPKLKPQKPKRRWWRPLLPPLVIIASLCGSFLVQSLAVGMAAIAVYAAVAWIKKLPSRYSFVMAFLSLAAVILLLLVRQNVELASNFSTYTFLLLVVGIVSVILEQKKYPKRKKQ